MKTSNEVEGTFNGEHIGGSLEEKASDKLQEWKKQYDQPELGRNEI